MDGTKKKAFLETEDQDQAGGGADVELLQCAEENDCSWLVNNDLDFDFDFNLRPIC